MTEDNISKNRSTKKGTVKVDVSQQVKDRLVEIRDNDGHTTMDSVIRSLLARCDAPTTKEGGESID